LSEWASHIKKKTQMSEDNFEEEEENWLWVPDGGLIPEQTGRLTLSHKITLTLTLTLGESQN
jgi:hypothetical protein